MFRTRQSLSQKFDCRLYSRDKAIVLQRFTCTLLFCSRYLRISWMRLWKELFLWFDQQSANKRNRKPDHALRCLAPFNAWLSRLFDETKQDKFSPQHREAHSLELLTYCVGRVKFCAPGSFGVPLLDPWDPEIELGYFSITNSFLDQISRKSFQV